MVRFLFSAVFAVVLGLSVSAYGQEEDAGRIAHDPGDALLDILYSQRQFAEPRLSPDGRRLFYIYRPEIDTDLYHLVVRDLETGQSRAVVIGDYEPSWGMWASNERILVSTPVRVYLQRSRTDNYILAERVISLSATLEGSPVVLFNEENRSVTRDNWSLSTVVDIIPDDPSHVLMPAARNGHYHLWRVNIETGYAELYERGRRSTIAWGAYDGVAVIRFDVSRFGRRIRIFTRPDADTRWSRTAEIRLGDRADSEERDWEPAGPSDNPGEILVRARPEGTEFLGIYRYNLQTGEYVEPVAVRDDYDISIAFSHGFTGEFLGYGYVADRRLYQLENEELQAHYEGLLRFFGNQIEVYPVSVGGDRMILRVAGPTELDTIYLYDFEASSIDPLFPLWPSMLELETRPVERRSYTARDGLEIESFMTWPEAGPGEHTPLLVMPHGGPEARDRLTFDDVAQYFAVQGYAVLQPNFRGSSGYGRSFLEAGYRNWGRAMQDDITDGVRDLIENGQVDPERICIVGFSYGAYAALAGAAYTPDLYQCAVGGGGVYDLEAFIEARGEDNEELREYWVEQIGDPDNASDLAEIRSVSPALSAEAITIPVLLLHGDQDRLVPVEQSRAMANALEAAGVPHVYVEESEGRHNWGRGEDNYRVALRNIEHFIADAMDGQLDSFQAEQPVPYSQRERDED